MSELTLLDLCSGIGGFSLAGRWNGFITLAFCEKEEFCQKVLRKNFPGVPIHEDVYEFTVDKSANLLYNRLTTEQREAFDMASKRKDYDAAVKMYNDGLSIGTVASYYEISRQAMWKILDRRGVQFRSNLKFAEENHFYRGGSTEDDRAQNLVETALRSGLLQKKHICETCGKPSEFADGRSGIQAHHCDYNKPLEVMWLCQKCHHAWHKDNKALTLRKEEREPASLGRIDLLTCGFP